MFTLFQRSGCAQHRHVHGRCIGQRQQLPLRLPAASVWRGAAARQITKRLAPSTSTMLRSKARSIIKNLRRRGARRRDIRRRATCSKQQGVRAQRTDGALHIGHSIALRRCIIQALRWANAPPAARAAARTDASFSSVAFFRAAAAAGVACADGILAGAGLGSLTTVYLHQRHAKRCRRRVGRTRSRWSFDNRALCGAAAAPCSRAESAGARCSCSAQCRRTLRAAAAV